MLQLISQNLLISAVEQQQHLQKQLKILSILFLFSFLIFDFDRSLYNQQKMCDQIEPILYD